MSLRLRGTLAAALVLASGSAWAADDYPIIDGQRNTATIRAFSDSAGRKLPAHVLTQPDGTPYSRGNGLPVNQAGSTGTDFSANPTIVSGTPLITIPATPGRAMVEVQNQSASQIQVVRDDGNGAQVTSILLTGVGAGQQGGAWSSATFKGRIQVYGPAGSQIAAYQD